MSVALYMDHNVQAAITNGLRKRGVDVITCAEDGMDLSSDEQVLVRATLLERAVFTQDDDFLDLAATWLKNARDFSGVIFARQLGITIGQAIGDLEIIAKVLEPADM